MVNSKPSKSTISTCLSSGAFFRISIRSRTSILTSHLERTLNRVAVGVDLILDGVLLLATSALGGDLGTEHLIDEQHERQESTPAGVGVEGRLTAEGVHRPRRENVPAENFYPRVRSGRGVDGRDRPASRATAHRSRS